MIEPTLLRLYKIEKCDRCKKNSIPGIKYNLIGLHESQSLGRSTSEDKGNRFAKIAVYALKVSTAISCNLRSDSSSKKVVKFFENHL